MDSNLDDSINLDSAMGVDFDHAEDTVVTQADITLDTSHESGIPMEFDHIEEQPMLLDAENEEIIVSDFMDDQFGMEEYSIQDDSIVDTSVPEVDDRHVIITQPDEMNIMSVPASSMIIDDMMSKPKKRVIQVKATTPRAIAAKKDTVVLTKTTAPRQVAIAPKPAPKLTGQPVLFQSLPKLKQSKVTAQYAIAPKPALKPLTMLNRPVSMVKKIPISGATVTSGAQGKTVLAQIGKQLVMMPAGGAQKIKLVTSATGAPSVRLVSDADQTQLVTENTAGTQASKPIIAKVVVQEQAGADGRGKLLPAVKYVAVQQKTVPISIANNKVVLGSPTKQGVRFAPKKHIIAMKSPTGRIMPATSGVQVSIGPKKMVITASQAQNLVLKTTAASKPTQMVAKIASASMPRTQLHQINVPGKGIQYIRLVTNPAAKTRLSPAPAQPGKTFVLTDNKGNVIQMGDKIIQGQQPPPLLVSGNINKLTSKPQQKLVRIAPLTSKPGQAAVQARSGQSLLAPLSPPPPPPPPPEEELPRLDELEADLGEDIPDLGTEVEREHIEEEPESKAALQALIADAVGEPDREHDPESSCSGSSEGPPARDEEHPLIVVPAYCKQEPPHDDVPHLQESHNMSSMINIEVEAYKGYQSPPTPLYRNPETEMIQTDLGLRPRKACNCTKSQCLKLYCDCFANGEFCNRCNCNNCHNNLENEELRQKAIRGCLDRNPNAFRPKIGKGKSGGPDIRRHNKGCNCKRSGCLKNYCECYEAKIACTAICKCVGCRNVEETVRAHHLARARPAPPPAAAPAKQPCSFMTSEVIEAVCQCLVAAGAAGAAGAEPAPDKDPVRDVIEEFARCLQDIISAAHHAAPAGGTPHTSLSLLDETHA